VAQVLSQGLYPLENVRLPCLLLRERPISEAPRGILARLRLGHARRDVVFGPGFQVKLEFVIQFLIQRPAAEQIGEPIEPRHTIIR
jgi:hypothetical protein